MRQVQNTNINTARKCKYNLFVWKPERNQSGGWNKWKDQGALHRGRPWGWRVHKHLFCLGNSLNVLGWDGIESECCNFAIRWVVSLRTNWMQVWKAGGLTLDMSWKNVLWVCLSKLLALKLIFADWLPTPKEVLNFWSCAWQALTLLLDIFNPYQHELWYRYLIVDNIWLCRYQLWYRYLNDRNIWLLKLHLTFHKEKEKKKKMWKPPV